MRSPPTAQAEPADVRHTVLVLGGGDVGSAVAHQLYLAGHRVLLSERAGSAHARRGMAFTDVLFDGIARLDGVAARWQSDVAGVRACWQQGSEIPVVTLPEEEIIALLSFDAIVDATMRRQRAIADLRRIAAVAIGLGPGHCPGVNCHAAIETQWGSTLGSVLLDRAPAERSGGPRALDGVTRERFVAAPHAGLWRTTRRLGEGVTTGEAIGELGHRVVHAPIDGTLRGLTRDGVAVRAGQRLIEVDPRSAPEVRGLGERPLAIAVGVASAIAMLSRRRIGLTTHRSS